MKPYVVRQAFLSRIGILLVAAGILVATLTWATPTASASTPSSSFCNGRSYQSVVKTYHRGSAAYPLRCGTSTWGFIHIVDGHGWSAATDSEITQVIAHGFYDEGVWNWRTCPNFRVPYNGGALNGTGVRPQGIITAYHSDS